jgi:hypothetical protein
MKEKDKPTINLAALTSEDLKDWTQKVKDGAKAPPPASKTAAVTNPIPDRWAPPPNKKNNNGGKILN